MNLRMTFFTAALAALVSGCAPREDGPCYAEWEEKIYTWEAYRDYLYRDDCAHEGWERGRKLQKEMRQAKKAYKACKAAAKAGTISGKI